jgi:hypothetical protein
VELRRMSEKEEKDVAEAWFLSAEKKKLDEQRKELDWRIRQRSGKNVEYIT